MKIVFAGTPPFAAQALQALLDTPDVEVVGVMTQPDSKAGRGMKLTPSAVNVLAEEHGLDCITPLTLRDNTDDLAWLMNKQADFLVVVAYGMILPTAWLHATRVAPLNVHASLLPRWRGAAPIERALLAGDAQTGVCIMRMEEGLDTGPIYASTTIPIKHDTLGSTLWSQLAEAGAHLLVSTIREIYTGALQAIPQNICGATYAAKLTADDRLIQWHESAAQIDRRVRCFTAKPGARMHWRQRWVKIISGTVLPGTSNSGSSGRILALDDGVVVQCGDGSCYRIEQLQPEGKAAMHAADFARGQRLQIGDVLQDEGGH